LDVSCGNLSMDVAPNKKRKKRKVARRVVGCRKRYKCSIKIKFKKLYKK